MSLFKNITTLSLLGALAVAGLTSVPTFAYKSNSKANRIQHRYSPRRLSRLDVVDRIAYYADLSTLVTAVSSAGLIDTLKSGNFTVLAPNNSAFALLPAGTVDSLLLPENKQTLTNILLYHVIPGRVNLKKLEDGSKIKTVLGQELTVYTHGGLQVKTGSGKIYDVSQNPYRQPNGFVYRLDEVLIPS